jgi:hypothetical protein
MILNKEFERLQLQLILMYSPNIFLGRTEANDRIFLRVGDLKDDSNLGPFRYEADVLAIVQ